jgi:hypothetical protein
MPTMGAAQQIASKEYRDMAAEALGAKIRLEQGAVLTKLDQHSVWLSFNE